MATILFWLALVTLAAVGLAAIEFAIGNRRLGHLRDCPPPDGQAAAFPKVSIVVAARNEERKIADGVRSLLVQDYPDYDVIAVDDRSTDGTGTILDQLADAHPHLRVQHIDALPGGWLGKNHAQHQAAAAADGELILFTDADVVMDPTVLRRAVRHLQEQQLDHLAIAPRLAMPGTLLTMLGGTFALFFGFYAKPWKARDPRSPRHIGIGAFNLIRTAVYRAIGGHQPIALRPDDDMQLGRLIKRHGHRQDVLLGDDLIHVEWYASLGELVRGLEKNSFAGVNYNPWLVLAGGLVQVLVFVWPLAALLVTAGTTWGLNLGILLLLFGLYADNSRTHGLPAWHGLALPLTTLLFQYIIWRAVLLTYCRGGIDWRGTHYALDDLRANNP